MQNKEQTSPQRLETKDFIIWGILFIFIFFALQLLFGLGGAIGGAISGLISGFIIYLLSKLGVLGKRR